MKKKHINIVVSLAMICVLAFAGCGCTDHNAEQMPIVIPSSNDVANNMNTRTYDSIVSNIESDNSNPKTAAAVVYEEVNQVVYATTGVNVRTGPSVDYERLGCLICGESIIRTGIGDNGWSKVIYKNKEAYICSYYLSTSAPSQVVYATDYINVRSGPGLTYDKIGTLRVGESVTRTGFAANGWSKVVYQSQVAYINSDFLSTSVPETVYATDCINVRSGPGLNYSRVGILNLGESVTRTGYACNGWSKVVYQDEIAYINSDFLSYVVSDVYGSWSDVNDSFDDNFTSDFTNSPEVEKTPEPPESEDPDLPDEKEEISDSPVDKEEQFDPSNQVGTKENGSYYGSLSIPSVGVNNLPFYFFDLVKDKNGECQAAVDAPNSGAFLSRSGGNIITDHANQGFIAMKASVPYETYAYVDYGTHTQKYVCTAIGNGTHTGHDLIDWNGNSLIYGNIEGGLAMYTCNDAAGRSITISYWQPV